MGSDAEVVLAVIKAVEERDGEKLFELYREDVELHEAPSLPYGGMVEGVASLREQIESAPENTWLGAWGPVQPTEDERRFDPRVISEKDGEVVVLYHMRAVAPDGERFESPVIGVYEVRDGKFARAQMFHYDTQGINAFLERARRQANMTRRREHAVSRRRGAWSARVDVSENLELDLDAGAIAYRDSGGDGPPVVLLHGLLMDSGLWDEVVAAIARFVSGAVPAEAHG